MKFELKDRILASWVIIGFLTAISALYIWGGIMFTINMATMVLTIKDPQTQYQVAIGMGVGVASVIVIGVIGFFADITMKMATKEYKEVQKMKKEQEKEKSR